MGLALNEIKSGLTILVDNQVYQIVEFQHVKPGKGAAFARVKLRSLKTSLILERTFRGDEKIEEAYVEERKLQYQYSSGDMYHFMDQENYEEISIHADDMQDKVKFLKDNLEVTAFSFKNEILNVVLPNFIEFTIISTEPGIKGDTAKGSNKPAKIDSGAIIQVPLFVNTGDRVKIDTRTGQYIERAY